MDYDLCIIGGGINGTAIARDAAGRGLSVLLVEAQDLANATCTVFSGQPTGCFWDNDGTRYVVYSVLLER